MVPHKLQQFAGALRFKHHHQVLADAVCLCMFQGGPVLTSELLRYCRCPSAISSKAELQGAKMVTGPGRSSTEASSVFYREEESLS